VAHLDDLSHWSRIDGQDSSGAHIKSRWNPSGLSGGSHHLTLLSSSRYFSSSDYTPHPHGLTLTLMASPHLFWERAPAHGGGQRMGEAARPRSGEGRHGGGCPTSIRSMASQRGPPDLDPAKSGAEVGCLASISAEGASRPRSGQGRRGRGRSTSIWWTAVNDNLCLFFLSRF